MIELKPVKGINSQSHYCEEAWKERRIEWEQRGNKHSHNGPHAR